MKRIVLAALVLAAAACGDDDITGGGAGGDGGSAGGDGGGGTGGDAPRAVTIRFAAEVNGEAFGCGTEYAGVGSTSSPYQSIDFRFYVHDVELVGPNGAVPVALDQNEFQYENLALLDFEDGSSACESGSQVTHTAITGTVPAGEYTGLRLKIGVPFELNHIDAATAPAPLDVTAMFWVWRSGYKFIRIDGIAGANAFNFHLGSTGCTGASPTAPPDSCSEPNRPAIELDGFNVDTSVIAADIGVLLDETDVTVNAPDSAPGCMSGPDPDCAAIFPRLALPFGETSAGEQVFLRVK